MRFELPTLTRTVHPSIWGGGKAGWSGNTASSCCGTKTMRLFSESQCDHTKSIGLCETTCGWHIHKRMVTCFAWLKRRGWARARRYLLTWHKRKSADVSKCEKTMSINSTGKCERLLLLLALKKRICRKYKVRSELLHYWVTRKIKYRGIQTSWKEWMHQDVDCYDHRCSLCLKVVYRIRKGASDSEKRRYQEV